MEIRFHCIVLANVSARWNGHTSSKSICAVCVVCVSIMHSCATLGKNDLSTANHGMGLNFYVSHQVDQPMSLCTCVNPASLKSVGMPYLRRKLELELNEAMLLSFCLC